MSFSGRRDRFRVLVQQMIHDRETARRKVPDHVAIVLKESQVHSSRIVVIELPKLPFLKQFLYPADSASKQERVVHQDREVLLGRKVDQFFCLRGGAGKRLLHEHMLTVFQSSFG